MKTKGRLRIYLGYATGSGKSFYLLRDAISRKQRGNKIAIAAIEHADRSGICDFASEFDRIPLETAIQSNYDTIIMDEMAFTNPTGFKHKKRFEDILELIAAGKNVFTTLNVQHLDSVAERLKTALSLQIQERVPDQVLNNADAIVFVDISISELQARIESGQIFAKDKAEQALFNFFTHENLSLLRKFALEVMAEDQLKKIQNEKMLNAKAREEADPSVLTVITDEEELGPLFEKMIHKGAKLASQYRSHAYVVLAQSSRFLKLKKNDDAISAFAQKMKTLTEYLGATFLEMKGPGLPEQIVRFCEEHSILHLIFAKEQASGFIQKVIAHTRGIDVHLIDRPAPKGEH